MKIISIVNRRGGVGKTSTAHALGSWLSLNGSKVLFVDLDSQANLTYDLNPQPAEFNSYDLLLGKATAAEASTVCQIGEASAHLIGAAPILATADITITQTGKEYRLREELETIAHNYDYCIIDTPPALNILTVNALTASKYIIIPAQAEIHSLQGILLLAGNIKPVKKYCNSALKVAGIILTRYNNRAILSQTMLKEFEAAAESMDTKLILPPIRENIAIKEAQASRKDIFTYAPKSNAAKDYKAAFEEMQKGFTEE